MLNSGFSNYGARETAQPLRALVSLPEGGWNNLEKLPGEVPTRLAMKVREVFCKQKGKKERVSRQRLETSRSFYLGAGIR